MYEYIVKNIIKVQYDPTKHYIYLKWKIAQF